MRVSDVKMLKFKLFSTHSNDWTGQDSDNGKTVEKRLKLKESSVDATDSTETNPF